MRKMPRTRIIAQIVVSASCGLAVGLWTRLPAKPDMNNLLGLIGSLIGSALAVVAGLLVLARQFETTDERQLRTMRALLARLREAGVALTDSTAALDPAQHVKAAFHIFQSTRAVATQLQANGPAIAVVAQLMAAGDSITHLHRMIEGGAGVATDDMKHRGSELVALSDDLVDQLQNGL